ncbi:MbtH family protein [Klebsiella pneumoniae]|uniref:MbtH family protein n=1 Tax=Klebsiella pneumoniae TaxID=573 RepID=A0A939SW06_KLEPN|nr:MbtH family protein [Klebsiella pneumoniae]
MCNSVTFDNPQGQFYILRNDQQQYSLWPAHCDLPAGWTVVCPAVGRGLQRGWRPTGRH